MGFKIHILILTLLTNFNIIYSQSEYLSCNYNTLFGYGCELTIQNPNGLNNFQDISGKHFEGKTDSDVKCVGIRYYSSGNSTNIPSIICEKFKYLTYFSIDSLNGATEIDEYSISNCENLLEFGIERSHIKKVYKNAFTKNLHLHMLNIDSSELTTLPAQVFPGLGNNLTYLGLGSNKLQILKPEWFQTLTKLEILVLSSNEIEELPVNIFTPLKNLNLLMMNNNKIKVISSKSFGDLPMLDFHFQDNHINAIDEKFLKKDVVYQPYAFKNNLCALNIFSEVTSEDLIECTDNYRAWESGCILGDEIGRICKLENEMQSITNAVTTKLSIDEFQRKNDALVKENQDLKSKIDILIVGFQSMQNQINMLAARL